MILNLVLIVVGAVLVLWGADRLTDGSVAMAEKMHISQLVIGLTIVALGTSMPEFCVSLVSALKGSSDLAVGNIVGSNIFNTLLIVGVAAMVAPITILRTSVRRDLPFAFMVSLVLTLMCVLGGEISRVGALVLLVLLGVFMFLTLKGSKAGGDGSSGQKNWPMWKALAWFAVGLTCLVLGSNVFVDGARALASSLGVSDAVIGLTIVACGTSLPELATSVVAARKGNSGIAIGNVLGSNVINICFILGITGLIRPLPVAGLTVVDMSVLVLSAALLWLFSFTKYKVARWEGGVLAAVYVAYVVWLVANA